MRTLGWILLALVAGAAGLWFASAPRPLPAATLAALPEGGDAARGETWFWAGGCASCHAAAGAKGDDRLKLGGIIGGGTTGAALAGLLAERSDESILVLEAGPDFGSFEGGGWPADVLDATWLAESHQLRLRAATTAIAAGASSSSARA